MLNGPKPARQLPDDPSPDLRRQSGGLGIGWIASRWLAERSGRGNDGGNREVRRVVCVVGLPSPHVVRVVLCCHYGSLDPKDMTLFLLPRFTRREIIT